MCHIVELKLFLNMAALKAFGKVGHRRNTGALNLTAQTEVSVDLVLSRDRVNLLCQLPGLLPALQVLKCHRFLPSLSTLPSPRCSLLIFHPVVRRLHDFVLKGDEAPLAAMSVV